MGGTSSGEWSACGCMGRLCVCAMRPRMGESLVPEDPTVWVPTQASKGAFYRASSLFQ